MRGIALKYIAFVMALVLALSAVSFLPILAEQTQTYFIFEHLEDEQGHIYRPVDNQLSLPLGDDIMFNATDLAVLSAQNNAFYISFSNLSDATKIRISYTYKEQGNIVSDVTEQAILPWAEEQSATLPLSCDGEQIESLCFTFYGDAQISGTILLHSFFDISTYLPTVQSEATLSRCHYDKESNRLNFEGALSYAATVRYEGETLALFALSEGDDVHLSGKTPIARTDISFYFSFSVSVSRNDELFKRYVVAAITSTGERVPLCAPTYPSFSFEQSTAERDFKGYHSQDFSAVVDNVPEMGIVDVYLDRLFSTQNEGILYAGEYDYYYFDQSYISELERRVKNLAGMGTSVYLRLLIGNSRDTLSFADEAPAGVVNRLAVLRNEVAQRDLYAVIDFITTRLQHAGELTGLILGRSADLCASYSYSDVSNLAQYSAFYAATLNLVCGIARYNIPTLRMLVPISDTVLTESAFFAQDPPNFFAELFLPSLLSALDAQILEPQWFGLMLESSALSDRTGGLDDTHYGIDRLSDFLSALDANCVAHEYLEPDILFSWQPNGEAQASVLHADYLLKYVSLTQNERVRSFLVDFSVAEEKGRESGAQSIDYLTKYINTDRREDAARLALSTLGIESLDQLYGGADAGKILQVYRADLTRDNYESVPDIKGSFLLWRFSAADDTLGWYEGTDCESVFVSSVNQTSALVVQIPAENDRGEIVFHFESPVDLSFAPLLMLPLGIEGKIGARYEIQLRLIGENAITYASAILSEGESESFYLDISTESQALSELRSIRLMARPLDGENEAFQLHFGGITVQSDTLTDKELADRVNTIWQNNAENHNNVPVRDYTVPLLITAIVAVVSIGVCLLLSLNHKRKKKLQ